MNSIVTVFLFSAIIASAEDVRRVDVVFVNGTPIRFESQSGKAWRLDADDYSASWVEIEEEDALKPGKYEMKVELGSTLGAEAWTIRIDQNTGETWYLSDDMTSWFTLPVHDPKKERETIQKLSVDELREKADEYVSDGEYRLAKRYIHQAMLLSDPKATDWILLGRIAQTGETEAEWREGVFAYSMAIRIDSKASRAYSGRAGLYGYLGDEDHENADYQKSRELLILETSDARSDQKLQQIKQRVNAIVEQGVNDRDTREISKARREAKRNKADARNPFGVEDVPNAGNSFVLEFAKTVELPGNADDANAKPWADVQLSETPSSIEGKWSGRWNGSSADSEWDEDEATIKAVGDSIFILFGDNDYLIEAVRQKDTGLYVGRYINLHSSRDSTPWVGKLVDNTRLDGIWTEGRWDFQRIVAEDED